MDRAERESGRPGPPESAVGPQGHPPRCRPGWWGCGAPRLFEAVGSCHTFDPFESRAAAYPFQLPLSPGCLPRGFANECNFTATKGTRRTESSRGKTALSFFFQVECFQAPLFSPTDANSHGSRSSQGPVLSLEGFESPTYQDICWSLRVLPPDLVLFSSNVMHTLCVIQPRGTWGVLHRVRLQ